jgi:hypothetical protein
MVPPTPFGPTNLAEDSVVTTASMCAQKMQEARNSANSELEKENGQTQGTTTTEQGKDCSCATKDVPSKVRGPDWTRSVSIGLLIALTTRRERGHYF